MQSHHNHRSFSPATTLAMIAFAAVALILCIGAKPADASVTKIKASKVSGRVVTFKPRGLDPGKVERGKVRISGRSRRLSATSTQRAVRTGTLTVRVPRTHGRARGSMARQRTRDLRRSLLIVTARNDSSPSAPSSDPVPSSDPAPSSDPGQLNAAMLMSPAELAALPTSGSAYEFMLARADAALANMNLGSTPDKSSPWLPNYNGSAEVSRPGTQTLAAALIYARTGEQRYRDFVIAANRYLIGTETEASTDGTAEQDKLLATSRQIGAFVLAANLVDMDPSLSGSRVGWEKTSWGQWLGALRTTPIGTSGQASNITELSDGRANNWGSFARAARIAIDIYLGDRNDLGKVVERFQMTLGEQTGGRPWRADQDLDLSFACGGAISWSAINPASCGASKSGVIVEDLSRSTGAYPNYDSTGIGYTMEAYQAMLFSAVLLERQGYDAFQWGDQALRRVMDWLTREGIPQGNGSTVERHESWIAQHFYGKSYPTVPASMGRTFGFTDWLYAS